MKLNIKKYIGITMLGIWALLISSCDVPPVKEKQIHVKHNYIILLDLSDRLIVQNNQPERDKELISYIYTEFEQRVRNALYIKSRDEIKVVVAPQRGANLRRDVFEDRLYINMDDIKMINRKRKEEERKANFISNIDSLYKEAAYSKDPKDYYGADIWKYFYEDLKVDYSNDTLTENFLFIITDGYPIVGTKQVKLQEIKQKFPDLHIVMLEASPREKDMEWDRIMNVWEAWFNDISIEQYSLIKRGAISKEMEQIEGVIKGT